MSVMPSQLNRLRNSDCTMGSSTATPYSNSGGRRNTATDSRERRGSIAVDIGRGCRSGRGFAAPTPTVAVSAIAVLRKGGIHRLDELVGRDVALHQQGQLLLQASVGGRVELRVPRHRDLSADLVRLLHGPRVQLRRVVGDGRLDVR